MQATRMTSSADVGGRSFHALRFPQNFRGLGFEACEGGLDSTCRPQRFGLPLPHRHLGTIAFVPEPALHSRGISEPRLITTTYRPHINLHLNEHLNQIPPSVPPNPHTTCSDPHHRCENSRRTSYLRKPKSNSITSYPLTPLILQDRLSQGFRHGWPN